MSMPFSCATCRIILRPSKETFLPSISIVGMGGPFRGYEIGLRGTIIVGEGAGVKGRGNAEFRMQNSELLQGGLGDLGTFFAINGRLGRRVWRGKRCFNSAACGGGHRSFALKMGVPLTRLPWRIEHGRLWRRA